MGKKRIITFVAFMCAIIMSSSAWAGGTVKAGTVEWAPYYGKDLNDGGFMTEITRKALKRAGWDYQIEFMAWNRAIGLCKQGKLDMVQGAYFSEEREKEFLVTDSYAASELVFFAKTGSGISYQKLEDLKGKKVGLIKGWTYPDSITKASFLTIEYTDKTESNIKKLIAGRVDLIVGSRKVVIDVANRKVPGKIDQLVILDPPITKNPLINVISRKTANGKDVVDAFNKGLKMIQEDGTYDAILKKHGF